MRYDNPELQDRLAEAYVLGTLPHLARRRLEALLRTRPDWQARIDACQRDFAPLAAHAEPREPPPRILEGLKRDLNLMDSAEGASLWERLSFWRPLGMAAGLAASVLLGTVGILLMRPPDEVMVQVVNLPKYVAVLQDETASPVLVITGYNQPFRLAVEPLDTFALPDEGVLKLWAVESETGAVRPLFAITRAEAFEEGLSDEGWQHIKTAESLILSLEPPGATPGERSGPVLYSGKCLNIKGPPKT